MEFMPYLFWVFHRTHHGNALVKSMQERFIPFANVKVKSSRVKKGLTRTQMERVMLRTQPGSLMYNIRKTT